MCVRMGETPEPRTMYCGYLWAGRNASKIPINGLKRVLMVGEGRNQSLVLRRNEFWVSADSILLNFKFLTHFLVFDSHLHISANLIYLIIIVLPILNILYPLSLSLCIL